MNASNATVDPSSTRSDEKASNRYPARRARAAAVAAVSHQESQALSRAAAESLATRRRFAIAAERPAETA